MTQTTLPLTTTHHDVSLDNFIVTAANQSVFDAIFGVWQHHVLIVIGEPFSGKSHLLKSWQAQEKASELRDHSFTTRMICDVSMWEDHLAEPLFHACNYAFNHQGKLLVALPKHPNQLPIQLADLKSRLLSAQIVEIDVPDTPLLSQLLTKQLAERQLQIAPNVLEYIVSRMERSYVGLHELVERLDSVSLRNKKPISMSTAREALGAVKIQ
jgi:chromosomal replication initiation ATPase DnaA